MSASGARVALLTGANGFIGRHLQAALAQTDWRVRCVSRAALADAPDAVRMDLSAAPTDAQLDALLQGVELCLHTAGIAHDAAQNDRSAGQRLQEFNVELTLRLYQAAVRQGCTRFIWLSSIKVLGDQSDTPLAVQAPYAPAGSYAQSKVAAEQGLLAAAVATTALIIVRPPLVYGPGVGANFRRLLAAGLSAWPLPLGKATAPRSLVGVENLCAALLAAAQAPAGIYHVADPAPVTVAQLLKLIAAGANQPSRLWPVPPALLAGALSLLGRRPAFERLFTSLLLDTSDSEQRLRWQPAHSTQSQLKETVTWFLSQR